VIPTLQLPKVTLNVVGVQENWCQPEPRYNRKNLLISEKKSATHVMARNEVDQQNMTYIEPIWNKEQLDVTFKRVLVKTKHSFDIVKHSSVISEKIDPNCADTQIRSKEKLGVKIKNDGITKQSNLKPQKNYLTFFTKTNKNAKSVSGLKNIKAKEKDEKDNVIGNKENQQFSSKNEDVVVHGDVRGKDTELKNIRPKQDISEIDSCDQGDQEFCNGYEIIDELNDIFEDKPLEHEEEDLVNSEYITAENTGIEPCNAYY
jgi:hypothetical protein